VVITKFEDGLDLPIILFKSRCLHKLIVYLNEVGNSFLFMNYRWKVFLKSPECKRDIETKSLNS